MDERLIQYKDGWPFYPVTFPITSADGLLFEDLQLEQLVEVFNKNRIKSAYVCSMQNYNFLERCSLLEHLCIELNVSTKHYSTLTKKQNRFVREYNIDSLYGLSKIKSISIIDLEKPFITSKIQIDLSKFAQLEMFCGDYKYAKRICEAQHLKTLWLNYYTSPNVEPLSSLRCLDTLNLTSSKLESLAGCEKLQGLQCLYLHCNRKLTDISALRKLKKSLKSLVIENCGKIQDFSVLGELESLESLTIYGNNTVESLSFIDQLNHLKTFSFTVNVLNGDLTPCTKLQHVFCATNRKHYNFKNSELPKGIYVRGNENITLWRRLE